MNQVTCNVLRMLYLICLQHILICLQHISEKIPVNTISVVAKCLDRAFGHPLFFSFIFFKNSEAMVFLIDGISVLDGTRDTNARIYPKEYY